MDNNYFFFENREYDIPFYRKKPRLTKTNAIILTIGFLIATITPFIIPMEGYTLQKALIITLATLIPIVYTMKDNLSMIFRIPVKENLTTILLGFLFYMALSILVSSLLAALGVPSAVDKAVNNIDAIFFVGLFIQLLGEELLKFIVFVLAMAYAYKRTNRKNSILIAIIVSQLVFAIFHIPAYGNIAHIVLSIGVVSSILPIIYLRTKNITVTYITHLLIDLVPILLTLIL